MDLTPSQELRYNQIIDKYLSRLNSFVPETDYHLKPSDAWPDECEVLNIIRAGLGLLDQTETWVLTWGSGDDGGNALVIAVFQKLSTQPEGAWDLTFVASHFDTMTTTLFQSAAPLP